MSGVVGWILSILGVVIVGAIIDLVLPSGRMNKYIKSIFATVTILVIILPIPKLIKGGFKLGGDIFFADDIKLDENFIDYTNSVKFKYMEKGLVKALDGEGIKNIGVKIVGKVDGINVVIENVQINLSKIVIAENLQHINKYELIESLVTKYLDVEKGVISYNE